MTVWLVRGGRAGETEDAAIQHGLVAVGWTLPDLSKVQKREDIDDLYQRAYPDARANSRSQCVGQLWAFSNRIAVGDLVVMPLRGASAVAIGKVTGDYKYRTDIGPVHHTRPVNWIQTQVPRTAFDQDILEALNAWMTVCQIQRSNLDVRLKAVLAGETNIPTVPEPAKSDGDTDDVQHETDLYGLARDQISKYIIAHFKGRDMERLVDAVLKAEGYVTQPANPGPDGGVDILAGSGPLGFSLPRLCVQVKSQQSTVDVTVFRTLQGSMQTFGADQGLLVCWGGFNKAVKKEARFSFFKIRCWDAGDLVNAVLRTYDKFSRELQAELPLKSTWILLHED